MNRFWNPVLREVTEAAQARCIVEIGVAAGLLTERVLEYCAQAGAVLHAIDPAPQIDVDEWQAKHGEQLVFHLSRSLDTLHAVHDVDVALVDGDHNWFTVHNELRLLESTAVNDRREPPLIALHDVDWPYGRRDMYYDPSTVPEEQRQPYRRLGLVPGSPEPVDGGINWDLYNAIHENTPHNGVRTAVEDFLAESTLPWQFSDVPGLNGLGLLVTEGRLSGNERLRAVIESLRTTEFLVGWSREVERGRIGAEIDVQRQLAAVRAQLDRQARTIEALEQRAGESQRLSELLIDAERRLAEGPELRQRIADLERELEHTRSAHGAAREQIQQLEERVMRGQKVLGEVFNSPSWRLTKPLRLAKRLVRGG